MNWLGWSTRAMLAAFIGTIAGAALYAWCLGRGWDAPYAVGVLAGLGAFVFSPDRSGLRGLLVMTLAIWAGAFAQGFAGPFQGYGVLRFHETLTIGRLGLHGVSGAAAFLLARSSLRRSAPRRTAGA